MKRLGLILLFVSIFLTGCLLDNSGKLTSAINKLNDADNYAMDISIDMTGEKDGEEYEVSLTVESLVNQESHEIEMTTNIDMGFMSFNIDSYIVQNDDDTMTTYTKDFLDGSWEYSISESDNPVGENTYIFLEESTKIESVGTKDGVELFEVTIDPEDLEGVFGALGEASNSESFEFDKPIVITVGIKDGILYSMELDLTDFIDENEEEITSASMKITFYDINKVEVSIPTSVIEDATLAEDEY